MKKIYLVILISAHPLHADSFQSVDINNASVEQIDLLPGIGKKLAANIVAHRKKHGAFIDMASLENVSGMTAKKLKTLDGTILFSASKKPKKPNAAIKIAEPELITTKAKPMIPLADLEDKTLSFHGLDKNFDSSLKNRVRRAAYLPRLSASFDMDHGSLITEKISENTQDSRLLRGGRDFGIGIKVSFDLDKLIYNGDELEIAKLHLKRLEKREVVIDKLHTLYFRYAAITDALRIPIEKHALATYEAELRELATKLDSMSEGAFTRFQLVTATREET